MCWETTSVALIFLDLLRNVPDKCMDATGHAEVLLWLHFEKRLLEVKEDHKWQALLVKLWFHGRVIKK